MHVAYVVITGHGIIKKTVHLSQQSFVVLYFAGISLITLLVITGNQFFLSSRYTVFIVLLISLITCQYFEALTLSLISNRNRLAIGAICVFLLALFIDNNISTGASKANLKVASQWLSQNIPASSKTACNEPRFVYYSSNRCTYSARLNKRISNNKFRPIMAEYDYLLVWVKKKDTTMDIALQKSKNIFLVQSFANKRGDEARIYKLN